MSPPDLLTIKPAMQASQQDDAISRLQMFDWVPDNMTGLLHAFIASFSVIMVSELGDKTFIISAIMAMKNSRALVFLASGGALLFMTILSVVVGVAVTVIPRLYTHYASIVLFLCFGLKMMHEAYVMNSDGSNEGESEFDEVKRSLDQEEQFVDENGNSIKLPGQSKQPQQDSIKTTATAGASKPQQPTSSVASKLPLLIKVFTMIFVAEWGDRSQISTVILAARENALGVLLGSLSGHLLCTGMAVVGGRFIADIISVRTMTWLGGITFLTFAFVAILWGD